MRYLIITLIIAVTLTGPLTASIAKSDTGFDTTPVIRTADEPNPLLDGIDWDEWLESIQFLDGIDWDEWLEGIWLLDGIDWDEWLESLGTTPPGPRPS